MASSRILFFLLLCTLSASAALVSDDVVNQRRLLQVRKPCPVNFENQNYTIITSQCKAPNYTPNPCCNAFLEFACPLADYINDLSTSCATNMFSYITTIGKFPQGLFSSICRDRNNREGLTCPTPPPSPLSDHIVAPPSDHSVAAHIHMLQLSTLLLILSLHFMII